MKKRFLSIIMTCLALSLSLLPTAVFAAEEDVECLHTFEGGLYYCDEEYHYPRCDNCSYYDESKYELHEEGEVADHTCDVCDFELKNLCEDTDGNHYCDDCETQLSDCENGDGDHTCDLCGALLEGLCCDDNDDHVCDNEACGIRISDCEECDLNEDNVCDLCGEGIYPLAGELNLEAAAVDGGITVTWDALEDAGEDAVSAYIVSCCLENTFEPLQQISYGPDCDSYSHTFTGLDNNVVYDVSVDAVYTLISEGYEEPFSATAITTVTALPGAPTILSTVTGNKSVTVEWSAPENKGFPEILYYIVTAEQNGMGFGIEVAATDEIMHCTLDSLINGQSYQIYVSAVNEIGQGAVTTTTVELPVIPYLLEIGGVAVTGENMNDVLGDGTVSYDPATHTLTLNNANIHVTEGNYGIRSKTFLTLKLIGENSVSCAGVYGFHSTDDVTVVGNGSLNVAGGEVGIYIAGGYEVGGLYLKEDVSLNVTAGNATAGNSYGVRVDDVLEVRDNASLTAVAGTAPERSCAIYAYDEFNVYDNAAVVATGADQSVDLNTDCDGIRATHITMEGGTVTATGGTAATTNGIFTQTFDMHGGTLTAASGSTADGACFGPSVALQATRSFILTNGTIYATAGAAGNDQSCGVLVSNGEMQVSGGNVNAQGGEANYSYGIKASQLSVSGGYIGADGAEGGWCSDGISVEGSLSVTGGTIYAKALDAETYSYGVQAFEMAVSNGYISASAGKAAESYGLWAFGGMNISAEEIRVNPNRNGFLGTNIVASAEDGYAIYSRTGIQLADTVTLDEPEGGCIAAVGEDELTGYYTAVTSDGAAARSAEIEPLTYSIHVKEAMEGMRVEVPVGWSANKAYCDMFEVEDFSEIVSKYAEKDGYTFVGCYTDEACTEECKYDFDTAVVEDITLYPKWVKIPGSGDNGDSDTTTETGKDEGGSATGSEIPNTGDDALIALWALAFLFSGAAAAVLGMKKKENE